MSARAAIPEPATYPQACLGFRAWELWDHQLYPLLQGQEHAWKPGENQAHCLYSHHHSPGAQCHCGFNAWYSLQEAINYPIGCKCPIVIGIIAGAGRTRAHHHGARFEKAQILALAPWTRTVHELQDHFESPDEYLAEVRATAEKYGALYCEDQRRLKAQADTWKKQGTLAAMPSALIPPEPVYPYPDRSFNRMIEFVFLIMAGFMFLLGPSLYLWHLLF